MPPATTCNDLDERLLCSREVSGKPFDPSFSVDADLCGVRVVDLVESLGTSAAVNYRRPFRQDRFASCEFVRRTEHTCRPSFYRRSGFWRSQPSDALESERTCSPDKCDDAECQVLLLRCLSDVEPPLKVTLQPGRPRSDLDELFLEQRYRSVEGVVLSYYFGEQRLEVVHVALLDFILNCEQRSPVLIEARRHSGGWRIYVGVTTEISIPVLLKICVGDVPRIGGFCCDLSRLCGPVDEVTTYGRSEYHQGDPYRKRSGVIVRGCRWCRGCCLLLLLWVLFCRNRFV